MLQWLKNTVPDPRVPEIGGSSPWWMVTAATRAAAPAPQNPRSPARRSTPHSRGHRRQDESAACCDDTTLCVANCVKTAPRLTIPEDTCCKVRPGTNSALPGYPTDGQESNGGAAYGASRGTFLVPGSTPVLVRSVPRQERNRSERAKVA